jgi:hypothetical protein
MEISEKDNSPVTIPSETDKAKSARISSITAAPMIVLAAHKNFLGLPAVSIFL